MVMKEFVGEERRGSYQMFLSRRRGQAALNGVSPAFHFRAGHELGILDSMWPPTFVITNG